MTNKNGWPSEFTRGHQIAQALGCKVDEKIDDLDEPIVAVKCYFDAASRKRLADMSNVYMDLIDDRNMVGIANLHPTVTMIAITDIMRDYLVSKCSNKVVVLPEHTCNFKREIRDRDEITTVGYVGSRQCFDLDVNLVKSSLKQIGLDFKVMICEEADNMTRQDVVDFYKTIDIQLAFRLPQEAVRPPIYRNPLKVFNAGSFKIPTIAYPEISYSLCAGTYFLEAVDIGSIIDKCYMLKNDLKLYEFYSERVYEWAKQFDIVNVAKQYAELSPDETFNIEENVERMRGAA